MIVGLPNATVRPLDAGGGWSRPWYQFLGNVAQAISTENSGANPAPITLTASPYTYRAPANGALIVQGGGISAMAFSRDGLNWYPVGNFYSMFPLSTGDQIRITYPGAAPVLTWVQR